MAASEAKGGPAGSPAPSRLVGTAWILLASVSFSAMGLLTKLAARATDTWSIILGRSVVVAVVALALLRHHRVPLRPGNPRLLMWRSVLGLGAMICFFWSLGRVPLGSATTLLYTSPLFTVLLARPLLGERVARSTLPLAAVAFGGVVLLVRPTARVDLGALAALLSGLLASLAYLSVRRLRGSDPPARIVWFFSLVCIALTAPLALHHGLPQSPHQSLLLLGVGLSAAGGQLAMTQAYRVERAAVIGPLSYATVVLSYLLGVVLLHEAVTLHTLLGVLLVVVAGALVARGAPPPAGRAHAPCATAQYDRFWMVLHRLGVRRERR